MCLHRAGAPLPFFICSDGHAQDRCRDEAGVPTGFGSICTCRALRTSYISCRSVALQQVMTII